MNVNEIDVTDRFIEKYQLSETLGSAIFNPLYAEDLHEYFLPRPIAS